MGTYHRLQIWIDGTIEEEAATVLASMGLTVSDAVRLLPKRRLYPLIC
jgi:antitoxin component of RelBE/YafQ-DinJ toxin-antitoxin module